ncbi:pirin family protein [Mucilaginibacter sp. RS28]|uniref:Pirin family protein n=1 Tax=Mucilaginibacter straminoryzae TaxID=2932774 RepID=A0A9X1X5P5_9SPHI|nr:pirin family protein [Mucilaginibacter straminoryzae]MCJ8211451.1 pirin family protein [Mucilaginibacter straminoryzae]
MSNIDLIIEERPRDIGNFMVGRLLPFHSKRMVGPFIFIDHMGPAKMSPGENIDIAPHPHIGLSTLTYLFEGSMMHRDGLGTAIEITPGQVNWMTAGKGLAHSERTPERFRETDKTMHGLQIWVALPKELEQMDPTFYHADAADLPQWTEERISYTLVAGTAMGKTSPVPVYSPLYFLQVKNTARQKLKIADKLYGECGIYILDGAIEAEGETFGPKELLVIKNNKLCEITLTENSAIYFFGGEPFPEERFIYWNFVATDQALIDAAKERWRNQQFSPVPGETDFIPLPPERIKN